MSEEKEESSENSTLLQPESNLIKAVSENSLAKVVEIVSAEKNLNINCKDEHGMSPLQHACYKGNLEIAKFLLERGADVNQNDHEHRYTCLMFAALGGHIPVIYLLLEYGANIDIVNTVGRNAAQMAAFVGQHQSVAAINNYIPRDQIDYYTKIQGQETEPRLPLRFVKTLHLLVCFVNINPIRLAYFFQSNYQLFEEFKKITHVLEHLSEKLFRNNEPNELLSFKLHYINFIFTQLKKAVDKSEKTNVERREMNGQERENKELILKVINTCIKFWLKMNKNSFCENLERLQREAIRSYPYQENSLFQQLVRTLSTIEIGEEPSAMSILSQSILGKAIDTEENNTCFTCSELGPTKRCSKCKLATYCDEICQKLHWQCHKSKCKAPKTLINNEDNNGVSGCNDQAISSPKEKSLDENAKESSKHLLEEQQKDNQLKEQMLNT